MVDSTPEGPLDRTVDATSPEQTRRAVRRDLERVRRLLDAAIAALDEPAEATTAVTVPTAPTVKPEPKPATPVVNPLSTPRDAKGIFAQLRSEIKDDTGTLKPEVKPEVKPEPPTPNKPPALSAPEAIRARRDAVITEVTPELLKRSRRMLRDEENLLLDSVRSSRRHHDPDRLLSDRILEGAAWSDLLTPMVKAVYLEGCIAVGKKNSDSSVPDRVLFELSEVFYNPLRERLANTIRAIVSEGPYESNNELVRVMGSALSARFREWRGGDLEEHATYVLAAAFTRGCYDGAGPGVCLKWVSDEPGRCPDADDNALEPTTKGRSFPTGQKYPPAHPGCRCFVIPDRSAVVSPEGKSLSTSV